MWFNFPLSSPYPMATIPNMCPLACCTNKIVHGNTYGANIDTNKLYLCQYRSRRCLNVRAKKRNGELHRLCDMHRDRANDSQRRLDRKRRCASMSLPAPKPKRSNSEPIILDHEEFRTTDLRPLSPEAPQPPISSIFSSQRDMELFFECLDLTLSS